MTGADEERERANVGEREMQYLCKEGGDLVFMDPLNLVQVTVTKELIGDAADLMKDNQPCRMSFFNERPVDVTLPTFVQLDVIATQHGVDGNTAAGNITKKVTVETGAVIRGRCSSASATPSRSIRERTSTSSVSSGWTTSASGSPMRFELIPRGSFCIGNKPCPWRVRYSGAARMSHIPRASRFDRTSPTMAP